MKDRINRILENYNLSSAQFAEKIGVQRSSISHIISGRNKPSYDFIVKIIEHFSDLNPEWLLTGKGNMLKTSLNRLNSLQDSDLFNQTTLNTKAPPQKASNQDDLSNTNHLNDIENRHSDSIKYNENTNKVTNVNNVKFVIFVYDDNSFEILNKK